MFSETLALDLQLTIGSDVTTIPGGHIKRFSLEARTYGFKASVEFWVDAMTTPDPLFRKLLSPELVSARLQLTKHHNVPDEAPDPLILTGLVTDREVEEWVASRVRGDLVSYRGYTLHFEDAAAVLWREHYPLMLYSDARLDDIIKAQLCPGVSFDLDWTVLKTKHPVVCLGLDEARGGPSFYDFIVWLTDRYAGVLEYDSQLNKYFLAEKKSVPKSTGALKREETEEVRVYYPRVSRHKVQVLNAYSEKPDRKDVDSDHAVEGVRRDVLLRSPVPAEFTRLQNVESRRLLTREPRLQVTFGEFPTITLRAGSFVEFGKPSWPSTLYQSDKTFRVIELKIEAVASDSNPELGREQPTGRFNLDMTAQLESKTEKIVDRPPTSGPPLELLAEGHVISEIGEDADKTYQIYSDPDTSVEQFKVNIPLWNKKIPAPFTPNLLSGQFYFPAFRNARVLVRLGFLEATIVGFLDWGPDVRLSMDSQGNHILFGHNPTSHTSLSHIFKDNKPQWTLKRVAGQDTELLQLDEGVMILQTKEDTSLKKAEQKYSVVAKVKATEGELSAEAGAAVAGLKSQFEGTSGEALGAIEGAIGEVGGAFDDMDGAVNGKVDEVRGAVGSALGELSAKTNELRSAAGGVGADLRAAAVL